MPVGGDISDSAALTGGFTPGGTIEFNLFGPADATCSGAPAFTSAPVPVTGNGLDHTGLIVINVAGTYHCAATYSGDADNDGAGTTCGDTKERSVVGTQIPTLTTFMLVLLGGILALFGALGARRRRRR